MQIQKINYCTNNQNKFNHNFKGVMRVNICSARYNCSKRIETTKSEDDILYSKIPNRFEIDDDTEYPEYNKKEYEIIDLLREICKRKEMNLPVMDKHYDQFAVRRDDHIVTYHTGSGNGKDLGGDQTKWAYIDFDVDLRKSEEVKKDIKNKIEQIRQFDNISAKNKVYMKNIEKKLVNKNINIIKLVDIDGYLNTVYENIKECQDSPF